MSKQYGFLIFIMLPVTLLLSNTLVVPAEYATIPAAVAAAVAGDTIMITQGTYNAGSSRINIDKKLTIIGSGMKEVTNGGTNVQGGFELTTAADLTKIMGIHFSEYEGPGLLVPSNCNGVIICNNLFSGQSKYAISISSNTDTIRYNIIFGGVMIQSATDVVINNNIIDYGAGTSARVCIQTNGSVSNLKILNNVVGNVGTYHNYGGCIGWGDPNVDPVSTVIAGNIFYNSYNVTVYGGGGPWYAPVALFSGNWIFNITDAMPSNGSGNGTGDPKFEDFNGSGYVYDDDPDQASNLHLRTDSPCIDASYPAIPPMAGDYLDWLGNGGLNTSRADCGIYGGPYPFPDPFNAPTIPTVTSLKVTPNPVSPGGTITLEVKGEIGSYTGKGNQ